MEKLLGILASSCVHGTLASFVLFLRILVPFNSGSDDPLHLKPNPAGMANKLGKRESSEDDNSDADEAGTSSISDNKSALYKPPMMSAAHYG